MNFEESIRQALVTAASPSVDQRVYPGTLPQKAVLPAVTYSVISKPRDYTFTGQDGTIISRVQVNCYGTTYAAAKQVATLVSATMSGMTGELGGAGGVVCQGAFLDDEQDDYDDEFPFHVVVQDWRIVYEEPD